jgi:Domain of unknown function (DUF4398)
MGAFQAMSRPSAIALMVLPTLLAMGCGPVQSTSYLVDTETMLEAARTAQADKFAPYEWTAANLYLQKSKEEVGFSDYEQAVDYGKKAVDFATRARDTALKVGRRSEPGLTPPPPPPVPLP